MRRLLMSMVAIVLLGAAIAVPVVAEDTEPPVITLVELSPLVVSSGDLVHVAVTVGDDVGVTGVSAGSYPLENTSGLVWEGDVPADPAYGVHSIIVTAVDAVPNSAQDSAQYRTAPVVGIGCATALDPVVLPSTSEYLFMMWGKATYRDADTFSITDGSSASTWVTSPNHGVCSDDFVVVKGLLDSTAPPAKLAANYYRIIESAPRTEMNISDATVGRDLEVAVNGYLPEAVPYGVTLPVTITSADASKVLLAKSPTAPGSPSIMLDVEGGRSNIPTFYVYGMADSGTVEVMATAPGCLGKAFTVTLAPSGFLISSPNAINTTSFSANTAVYVRPARLHPGTLTYATYQNLRGGVSAEVSLTCSDPAVGILTAGTLSFSGGDNTQSFQFDPVGAGTADISLTAPQGFNDPNGRTSITATVSAPDILASDNTVGLDLQTSTYAYLQASPPEPVDMVVTVADPSVATITADPDVEGSASVTFSGVANTGSKTFYVQGRSIGSTTFTTQAAGYNPVTKTITVDPSGFMISSPGSFATTSFSSNATVYVRPARLRPDNLGYSTYQSLRGGMGNVEVEVTSSDPGVGAITSSPLIFSGNTSQLSTSFDPKGAGTAVISISTPQGFSTPTTKQSIEANVTAPDIVASDVTVGLDLQTSTYTYLQANPPAPVDVVVSVDDSSVAIVSADPDVLGSAVLTIGEVANTGSKTFYVQGLSLGTTTMTITAEGYNPVTKTITVDPSGFMISSPGSFGTTYYSADTNIYVRPARLRPDDLGYSSYQNLRAGMADVTVPVTISDPNVGTITASPLVFSANTNQLSTTFDPVSTGTATISIGTPQGFSTPSTKTSLDVTVRVPVINASDETVGRDLQKSSGVYLEVAPPNPVDIVVTVGDTGKATLSTDPLVEGSGTITFTGVTNTGMKTFYVQGRGLGATALTVTAQGYESVEKTITIDPSGFVISSPSSITTTLSSNNSLVRIAPARLNPNDFRYASTQALRGGLSVNVPVLNSDPTVGVLTTNPVLFGPNNTYVDTWFEPLAMGTTVISVDAPTGFTAPTTKDHIDAVVNP